MAQAKKVPHKGRGVDPPRIGKVFSDEAPMENMRKEVILSQNPLVSLPDSSLMVGDKVLFRGKKFLVKKITQNETGDPVPLGQAI